MEEQKDKKDEERDFVDPSVVQPFVGPILLFLGQTLIRVIISFFTLEFLKSWWKKWKGKNDVDSKVPGEDEKE